MASEAVPLEKTMQQLAVTPEVGEHKHAFMRIVRDHSNGLVPTNLGTPVKIPSNWFSDSPTSIF